MTELTEIRVNEIDEAETTVTEVKAKSRIAPGLKDLREKLESLYEEASTMQKQQQELPERPQQKGVNRFNTIYKIFGPAYALVSFGMAANLLREDPASVVFYSSTAIAGVMLTYLSYFHQKQDNKKPYLGSLQIFSRMRTCTSN